jgi:hypothetical protein
VIAEYSLKPSPSFNSSLLLIIDGERFSGKLAALRSPHSRVESSSISRPYAHVRHRNAQRSSYIESESVHELASRIRRLRLAPHAIPPPTACGLAPSPNGVDEQRVDDVHAREVQVKDGPF